MSKNKRRTKVVDLDKKQLLSSIAFFRAMNVSQKKKEKIREGDLEEIVQILKIQMYLNQVFGERIIF